MGKSSDFSASIATIREAHGDAVAILEKWRELITAPGDVDITIKDRGVTRTVTLPSIRAAIDQYLGETFESLTLSDGTTTVILRLNANGQVELVTSNDMPANMAVGDLAASSVTGRNGSLSLVGRVTLTSGTVENATIQSANIYSTQIYGAEFSGGATVTGGTTITGSATIKEVVAGELNVGVVKCRKQVLDWATVATIDSQIAGPTSGGLWTGDVSVLENAGIKATPTWSDCIYIPRDFPNNPGTVNIYWGETGDVLVQTITHVTDINTTYMGMWPYKMYEKVGNAYRIRWLPFDDQLQRITYVRTGGLYTPVIVPFAVKETSTGTGTEVIITSQKNIAEYQCRRLIADWATESGSGAGIATSRLYGL